MAEIHASTSNVSVFSQKPAVNKLLTSVSRLQSPWATRFYCLRITNCNADEFASFSQDISMGLELLTKSSSSTDDDDDLLAASLMEIFTEMLKKLRRDDGDEKLKLITSCFERYRNDLDRQTGHITCLKEMRRRSQCGNGDTQKLSEAEIQAVLACHFFSPLLAEGEIILDRTCYKNKVKPKCPFCDALCQIGNTNYGCRKLWHGRADMVIESKNIRRVVTCKKDTQDEGKGEPAPKKAKLDFQNDDLYEDVWNTTVEVKTSLREDVLAIKDNVPDKMEIMPDTSLKQSIAQTLVNAFLAVKENKKLENCFVPSFLVSDEGIFINFYNVKEDVLLVQAKSFTLFNERGKICNPTVFAVWLALNFDKFPGSRAIDDKDYCNKYLGMSGFRKHLVEKNVLHLYESDVESGFLSAEKPISNPIREPNVGDFMLRLYDVMTDIIMIKKKE